MRSIDKYISEQIKKGDTNELLRLIQFRSVKDLKPTQTDVMLPSELAPYFLRNLLEKVRVESS